MDLPFLKRYNMYKIGNKTYADAGHYLKRGSSVGYAFTDNGEEVKEVKVRLDDMRVSGSLIIWSDGSLAQMVIPRGEYGDYKKAVVQKKYSNDDQIAIMLNKDSGNDDDQVAYRKMQEWREWASVVAHKIMDILTL